MASKPRPQTKPVGGGKPRPDNFPKVTNPVGRPSSYDPKYVKQAEVLCKLGCTDEEIGAFFGIGVFGRSGWRSKYPEFAQALKAGKTVSDDRVERGLYMNAVGFYYDAVKIFCNNKGEVTEVPHRAFVPPQTIAQIFWLKNRRPDLWRDVHKIEHGGAGEFSQMSDEEVAAQMARAAQSLVVTDEQVKLKSNGKGNGRLN